MNIDSHLGLIDAHCHLDLYPNYEQILNKTELAQIYTLTMTTTPRAWRRNHELTHNKKYIRAALGLHPQIVSQCFEEFPLWKDYLCETRYVGEVGLDATPRYYESFEKQKYIFRNILEECTAAGGKIISVHSKRCASVVLSMIERYLQIESCKIILHWFLGNKFDLQYAIDLGCYFSINTEMAKTINGRRIISTIPLNYILTESDGPFISIDGKPAEPLTISYAINAIAKIRDVQYEIIRKAIDINFISLLEK